MPINGHVRRRIGTPILGLVLAIAPVFAASSLANEQNWIVDPHTQCGTSNPFLVRGESIRWYGQCLDGKLHGEGTLIWYQGATETERNEGTFRNGESHGIVVTGFPDGRMVFGQYVSGVRHGDFMIISAVGRPVQANYENGQLKSQNAMSEAEVADWKQWYIEGLFPTSTLPASMPAQDVVSQNSTTVPAGSESGSALPARDYTPQLPTASPAHVESRQTAPVTAESASSEGGVISYLNPLKWNFVGAVKGLLGLGSDKTDTPVQRPAPRATAAPVQQAQARHVGLPPRESLPVAQTQARPASPVTSEPARYDVPTIAERPGLEATAPAISAAPGAEHYAKAYTGQDRIVSQFPYVSPAAAVYDQPKLVQHLPAQQEVEETTIPPLVHKQTKIFVDRFGNPVAYLDLSVVDDLAPHQPLPELLRQRRVRSDLRAHGSRAVPSQVGIPEPVRYGTGRFIDGPLPVAATRSADTYGQSETGYHYRSTIEVPSFRTDYEVIGDSQRVVVVNSPVPLRDSFESEATTSTGMSQIHNSPYLSKWVCSRPGLYQSEAKWCGLIRRDDKTHFVVEVREVQLNSFGMIGISRSTCTGGTFLNWFSRGTTVSVPKNCLAFRG